MPTFRLPPLPVHIQYASCIVIIPLNITLDPSSYPVWNLPSVADRNDVDAHVTHVYDFEGATLSPVRLLDLLSILPPFLHDGLLSSNATPPIEQYTLIFSTSDSSRLILSSDHDSSKTYNQTSSFTVLYNNASLNISFIKFHAP